MVSTALIKLSSPVAKSCLIALGVALMIDAVLTFFAASQYPYLIAYTDQLFLQDSLSIVVAYSAIGAGALLISASTAVASYKSATNFVLIHACITGVFLPVSILVYFTSLSSRYKVGDYVSDYKQMIADYRVSSQRTESLEGQRSSSSTEGGETAKRLKLSSFINLIDSIQTKFSCCGVESLQDWVKSWEGYIPPSCCPKPLTKTDTKWTNLFKVENDYQFQYCEETAARHLGCLAALKEDEQSKFAWLSNLIVFIMVLTITNTIVSLLLFGLSKTENMPYDSNENELAMVGMSTKPRPSQPEITSIRHRPSVVHTLGANKEQIAAISHAVRFNLSNSSPRGSISGAPKFSAGARRGSAFV